MGFLCVVSAASDTVMSLPYMVEQAIKSCKTEQNKVNDSIQLYRELLQSLTPQPKTDSDESDCADDAATGTDASPGEKEDMELLERALEKALRVRTGTGSSKEASNKQSAPRKELGSTAVAAKEGMLTSKSNQSSNRSTSSKSLDRNKHRNPGTTVSSTLGSKPSVSSYNPGRSKTTTNSNTTQNRPVSSAGIMHHQAARKSQQAVSASGSLGRSQLHTSALCSKNKTIRSNALSGSDLGEAAACSTPSNNTVSVSQTGESGAHSLPQQNGGRGASDQTAKWKSLRSKQHRLWDNVVALQRKPVPGRSRFMERMRATFPTDWPRGCPDQTRALVDRLTHQGHDLARRCQTEELLAKRTPGAATEIGGETNKYDSCLTPMTVAQLQNFAHQAKQEWEAWDRWRPEGGCLCPTGVNGVWGDGMVAPLPPTITYRTEAELGELETLRMRVALLQQEIHLEQALFDALSPQLSSVVPPGPGCPSITVLRDVYSLLGEGGERFPAIVLDSESE